VKRNTPKRIREPFAEAKKRQSVGLLRSHCKPVRDRIVKPSVRDVENGASGALTLPAMKNAGASGCTVAETSAPARPLLVTAICAVPSWASAGTRKLICVSLSPPRANWSTGYRSS
jgi:hypothetical protein